MLIIILIRNLKFHFFDIRINSIGFNFDHSLILIDNVGNDTRMVTSILSNSRTTKLVENVKFARHYHK